MRALLRSPQAPEVLCSPGNAGIALEAAPFDGADDPAAIAAAGIDLVVVGPEVPLVAGFVDRCAGGGRRRVRPGRRRRAARGLQGLRQGGHGGRGRADRGLHGRRPTSRPASPRSTRYPVALKADGLAAGKGVVIAAYEAEARATLEDMLVGHRFGDAPVVVEEFLEGVELSVLALCDGESALPLAPARDFKRIGEGDTGPNTGGMGAFSPVEGADAALIEHVRVRDLPAGRGRARAPRHAVPRRALRGPDADRGRAEGDRVQRPLRRSGDAGRAPAAEERPARPVPARGARPAGLAGATLEWDERAAVTVVLASRGYPASSSSRRRDQRARGRRAARSPTRARPSATATIVTAGGRVLNVTALGEDREAARAAAYAAADKITFDGKTYRRDIAA